MIRGEEEDDVQDKVTMEDITKETLMEDGVEISVHAFSSSVTHSTLKLKGMVGRQVITILVDSGSNHNFLDQRHS